MRQQRRRNDPVTPKQIAMLHVAKSTLQMKEGDYRLLLESYGGVASSKELKQESFKRVLARFEELGFDLPKKPVPLRTNNNDGTMPPSAAQLSYMDALFRRIGMPELQKQEAFIRRMLKKPAPVMKYEANKVIEALKKMAARGFKAGERSDGRYEKAADA